MYLDAEWEEVHARNVRNLLDFLRAEGLALDAEAFTQTFHRQRERAYEVARATRVEYPVQRTLDETLLELGYPHPDGSLLSQGVEALFRYEESRWRLFPDTLPTLESLRRAGYRLGLLSNASDDGFIQRLLRRLGLAPYLCPALNSAGVGIRKPAPRLFRLLIEEWDLEPCEVAMVGDSLEADILGAQLAGMRSILALMHENPANDELRASVVPEARVESLSELPELLSTWAREGA